MGRVSWSDLQKELLLLIAQLLETGIDITRFRSVCTSWRSLIPPYHKNALIFPLELPHWISPNDMIKKRLRGFFNLTESTVYRIQPIKEAKQASSSSFKSTGWLMRIQETKPGKMRLLNLLCSCSIQHPNSDRSIKPSCNSFTGVLNFLDFHISIINKDYSMQYRDLGSRPLFLRESNYSLEADKVVLSSNHKDYSIMALHSGGSLGLLNSGDKQWTIVDKFFGEPRMQDVVNHRGQLLAVSYTGSVISKDFSAEKPSLIALPLPGNNGHRKHLVSRGEDLVMVERYFTQINDKYLQTVTTGFKVFKLNRPEQEWVEIKTLGDEILFLGDDCSFFVSAKDFSGGRDNSIYFKESYYDRYNQHDDKLTGLSCRCIGIFNLDNGFIGPVAFFPGYSDIFWPPPPWFQLTPAELTTRIGPQTRQKMLHKYPALISFVNLQKFESLQ